MRSAVKQNCPVIFSRDSVVRVWEERKKNQRMPRGVVQRRGQIHLVVSGHNGGDLLDEQPVAFTVGKPRFLGGWLSRRAKDSTREGRVERLLFGGKQDDGGLDRNERKLSCVV